MLKAFENSNIRILIRYHEMPVEKISNEWQTLPDNPELVKQRHHVSGIEIIDVHTKQIINISFATAEAMYATILDILGETPPPISVNEAEAYFYS